MRTILKAIVFAAISVMLMTGSGQRETPPLLIIGARASLHGPIVFRDAKGKMILRLRFGASISVATQR